VIKNFNITNENKANLFQLIERLDPTKRWVCNVTERKSKRSTEQNSRYWKLLTELGKYLGYEAEEMHDLMRFKFLKRVEYMEGKAIPILKSTTKLSVEEMTEYQEKIERWAAGMGFIFDEV